jgi:stage II sporulation protein D
MHLFAALIAALTLATAASGGTTQAEPARVGVTTFVLTGGGWGHGVGLSQWGAYGQALAGRGHREILAWYYPHTNFGGAPVARVRVLLAAAAKTAVVSSPVAFRVRDAAGIEAELAPGTLKVGPGLKVAIDGTPTPLTGPLRFLPGQGAPLSLGGIAYRGELHVTAVAKSVQVVNSVALEAYLRGVVAKEMPKDWPLEALKAQAVAARSYALARVLKGKPYDLYADWRSQVYGGVPAEAPRATQAVQATARQVLLYDGKMATTFFFSSSGGRTATGAEVFGVEVPYLVSVADPWDERSPHHVWQPRMLTGAAIKKAYALAAVPIDVSIELTPSKRPGRVVLVPATGGAVETNGIEMRARLGLLSPNFRLGVMRLERPVAAQPVGTPIRLTGIARGVLEPALEELREGVWARVAQPKPRPDGTFTAMVRPAGATRYRLTGSGFAGPVLAVPVAGGGA